MTAGGVRPVLLVALVALGLAGCADDTAPSASAGPSFTATAEPTGTAAPTEASTTPETTPPATTDPAVPSETSAPGAPDPAGTAVAPTDGTIQELPPVAVGDVVDAGGGLTAEVVDLEASEITGGVPGDVAGPAVAVTVAVTNTGSSPADIGFVTVSAGYGDGQEAPGFEGGLADPLVGPVPAGSTREGTYVFGVPDLGTGTLVVRVGTDPARPLAVFTADPSVWGDR